MLVAGLLSGGCATSPHLVVLLPDDDGSVGRLEVATRGGAQVLDEAYEGTSIGSSKRAPSAPRAVAPEEVERRFGAVLDAQPEAPERFVLYFEPDSSNLVAASLELIPEILRTIDARPAPRVSVVGHTDTSGEREHNVRLSLSRAESVAGLLTARGVPPEILQVTSHGEEDPLVVTPDGVAEPRNRRVEVTVR